MDEEKELIEKIQKAVIDYEEEEAERLCNEVIKIGMDPEKAIAEGLSKGMRYAGELFENESYGIPEVLLCADALETGMKILKPHLKINKEKRTIKVFIGTVEGDIHSIGKNMVKLMFEVGGFEVLDLGVDVDADKILDEIDKNNVGVIALSTMMNTTLINMERMIDIIKNKHPKIKIMVGGASVTSDIANRFGADGWAENSSEALKNIIKLTQSAEK